MRKYIYEYAIYMIAFFALVLPVRGRAQITFDLDNAKFSKVSTDTSTRITTIRIKTKSGPEEGTLECKDATIAYSFRPKNVKVDMHDGNGKQASQKASFPGMAMSVEKITWLPEKKLFGFILIRKHVLIVEGRLHEELFEALKSAHQLPSNHLRRFKVKKLILTNSKKSVALMRRGFFYFPISTILVCNRACATGI